MTIIDKICAIFDATDEQRKQVEKLFKKRKLQIPANTKPDPNGDEWQRRLARFDKARRMYPGTKGGVVVEFNRLLKVVTDEEDLERVLIRLSYAIQYQIDRREFLRSQNEFVPPWKNFPTWLNNRCWDEFGDDFPRDVWYKSLTHEQVKFLSE